MKEINSRHYGLLLMRTLLKVPWVSIKRVDCNSYGLTRKDEIEKNTNKNNLQVFLVLDKQANLPFFPCNFPVFSYVWILSKKSYACDKPGLGKCVTPQVTQKLFINAWTLGLTTCASKNFCNYPEEGGGREGWVQLELTNALFFPCKIWLAWFCNTSEMLEEFSDKEEWWIFGSV